MFIYLPICNCTVTMSGKGTTANPPSVKRPRTHPQSGGKTAKPNNQHKKKKTKQRKQPNVNRHPRSIRTLYHYETYIYRVLKTIDPEISITRTAMGVMNDFILDMLHQIATEAGGLCSGVNLHQTLAARDIQSAIKSANYTSG